MSKTSGYGDGPGINSEELVKELVQKSGWCVKELRKAADSGRAPLLENEVEDSLRLVDFQVHCQQYRTHYIEVKSKANAIHYGIEDEYRHGWERSQHEDYVEFAKKYTDDPVYVFVHEREAGVILRQRVRNMSVVEETADEGAFGTDEPMVFFRRDGFDVVTDDVSQYAAGFGQAGLVDNDISLSPFGNDLGGQAGLDEFGGVGDD